jgi:hypothetical protein
MFARPSVPGPRGTGLRPDAGSAPPILTPEALMHSDLLILGDSHVGYLRQAVQMIGLLPWQYQFCEVGGATAVGMRNPFAAVNALQTFRDFLQDKSRQATIIVQLGEADCGFVVWYRAQLYDEPVQEQLSDAIGAYLGFLMELQRSGFHDIVITGATLPTMPGAEAAGEAARLRRDMPGTLEQRTRLTLDYNKVLQAKARDFRLHYLDISADLLDPETKTVRGVYRNPDPSDHHLDHTAVGRLWADKLRGLIFEQTSNRRFPAA